MKNNDEKVESLWVKIRSQANKENVLVGVHSRPPHQGQPVDEAFLLQLWEALILLGNFSHPDICWQSVTASCKWSRRVLESVEAHFLIQVVDSLTRGEALFGLLLTNMQELIWVVKVGGSLVTMPWSIHNLETYGLGVE